MRSGCAPDYFTDDLPGAPLASRFWTYDLTGAPDANSPSVIDTMWIDNTDIDADGVPESSRDVAYTGLFDVNGDGNPDRITSSGPELQVQLWNPATKTFVTNQGSSKAISGADVTVGSVWDIDGSGRLAVISTDTNHKLFCHRSDRRRGEGGVLPPHFPSYLRTYQWDNYEPNDGQDTNGDGMPDAIIRVPSALTSRGDFYGYISTQNDKDYYLIDGAYSGPICMTSPKTAAFTMKVFSFSDKLSPVGPDGLVWQNATPAKTKCFSAGSVNPPRSGEYRFIVGIESQGTASPLALLERPPRGQGPRDSAARLNTLPRHDPRPTRGVFPLSRRLGELTWVARRRGAAGDRGPRSQRRRAPRARARSTHLVLVDDGALC